MSRSNGFAEIDRFSTKWRRMRQRFGGASERLKTWVEDDRGDKPPLEPLMDEYARSKEALLRCPAPSLEALVEKLEILYGDDLDPGNVTMAMLIEDARRLSPGAPGHSASGRRPH